MAVTEIQFTSHVFKEGGMYVAYTPELDLSSCARTEAKASKNLQEAVRLFLEEAEKHGTLRQILEEAGFEQHKHKLEGPKFIATRRVTIPVSLAYAKN
jgi:predicted RNase H-like HicB family nuclease